jgi:hypothetical protein
MYDKELDKYLRLLVINVLNISSKVDMHSPIEDLSRCQEALDREIAIAKGRIAKMIGTSPSGVSKD